MTVRRLAQLPELNLTLIAGRENGDRTITWAHAIELADPTPYLAGGELVMTTGMNVGVTEAEQLDYLARLSATGVAALAFDTGTTHDQVPRGIISAGDALGLPVLAVPPQTPFIAITRAVIDEVNADQLRSVQRVVDQQEVMAREALRNGIPAVVTALSNALSATTVVIATDGSVLAAAGPDIDRVAAFCLVQLHSPRSRRGLSSKVLADGEGYCSLQTLRAAQTLRGYMAVRTEVPLSPPNRLLVSHAVALISIELDKPAKVLGAEQRLRTAVTALLIAQPSAIEPGILRYFGFTPEDPIAVVVLTNTGPALAAERQTQQLLDTRGVPYLMWTGRDEILLVVAADGSVTATEIRQALGAQLQRHLGGGLSLPGSFQNVDLCVNQARTAARAYPDDHFREFAAIGVFGVILGNRSTAELDLLVQRLRPLEEHDRQQNSATGAGLVASLEAYLSHNGQIENAAATLGVHRHTMRNRLAKISELTHTDLGTADSRAELWVALKARDLLAVGSPPPAMPQDRG
ncbi:PucR family transcriptional regulator [Mycolicibacterium komossense]|uniref:PucR family transcriptional regulator ligand-binding domain-containing protein n=1 Tax=Mycolicibacterium komossense TaxID=1779 RepID=A0ABT3CF95_9MYCO|nr:PucR family transcriptional regulator [Mycolicibacterium komossense]MCV7228158.1 PucR family transcriptional regulator ligand-binding domain-containing protein [Mycolicibacterium komossense]